ncbi:MAG: two-component system sensor histidine kinase NtrB [Thermodesulfobacteriota bacterium]
MTSPQNVRGETNLEPQAKEHLQRLLLRVCLFRLFFLVLLLLPLGLAWLAEGPQREYLGLFLEPAYTVFLVSGFGLTLFFLLGWPYFQNTLFFFRLQLVADLCLAAYLILLTGGLQSHFSFIFLALIFLYGRILGLKTAKILALCCSLFLLGLFIHALADNLLDPSLELDLGRLTYFFSLQLLALGLILVLLNLGYSREDRLLSQLADQERRLRRSENIRSKVLDWMTSGLMVLDQQGDISSINRRAAQWAGQHEPRSCIGKPLSLLFPDMARVWSSWDKSSSFRTEIQAPGDEQIFGATFTPIAWENSSLIIFKDITRIKDLEQQVQQMEKLASIGELAAGLAHEIKNPLAGIQGSLQLITQNNLSQEHKQRLRQVVNRDIQRLDHLLSDFLVFARPSRASPRSIQLGESLEHCLQNLHQRYPGLKVQLGPELQGTYWTWDQDQLQQVLLNLLLNAAQAGAENSDPRLEISLNQDPKGVYLAIRDHGPGLPADKARQIFDPFVSSKKQGSGLGLSIAQRLAAQNNSWIEMHNRSAVGAEARLYCPSQDRQENESATPG